ncbi:two-component system, sensor histidine kinase YesM [Pseudobutyrivibrio sp. YE44]|uniref:sensor histidine kinase n=1 Tax=Pseudobutyrivibrio sp. YE44 TaxID=1520802 RepID=UPI0008827461|nr:sensor histidine kinase [Pseudobutyrivibrio sp. YE44]SDB51748.1 two-component system, sensor histidine kinase YesM [Pseudobutyrivibrio sp. YE44]
MRNVIKKKQTMSVMLRRLISVILVPMSIVIAVLIGILSWYAFQYQTILANVTEASAFNQDFKNVVDLKMFYYVSDSAYADGKPIDEVENARKLAEELLDNTTQKKSMEAITSVRNLCVTLEQRMDEIDDAASYDEGMEQLENNIYILTDLIQTYMYDYLYYESAYLSSLQEELSEELRYLILGTVGLFIIMTLAVAIYTSNITERITHPITKLAKRVEDIKAGDFEVKEAVEADSIEIQSLSDGFEDMVGQLNNLIQENKKAERRKRHAELELLQAQINPHFLYNTLDTIIWLIEADKKEDSIQMVSALSDFFRFCLSRGRDIITLEEEQKHVLSYLAIQKTRYQDRMDYEVHIPASLYEYSIPKLTLQPLVENSIYHGIKLQREKGVIRVDAVDIGDKIELTVKDNGAGMTEARLQEMRDAMETGEKIGFGLRTVHQRMQLLYGDEYGLTISSTEGVGTTITAVIPKVSPKGSDEVLIYREIK